MIINPRNDSSANDTHILEDSIFKIGKVISVDGRTVKVKVDKTKNTSHFLYKGELLKNISVGGYIKIIKGFTKIVGKVEGEYIGEDKLFGEKLYSNQKDKINRILNISLLGFFNNVSFERGIKELPLIDNECFLLHNAEFNQVHNFIKKDDKPITIGTLSLEKGQKIDIGINSLFASHIGVFGNTGSGKSYTLAKIYRELFKTYKDKDNFRKNSSFFLLDFNGEYIGENVIVEKKYKNIYDLSTRQNKDRFPVTEETISDPSFWTIILEATEKTQTPFLRRALTYKYFSEKFDSDVNIKAIVKELLLSLTSHKNESLEKGIIVNFLKELLSCLQNKMQGMGAIIDDYQKNLQWHNLNKVYYYIDTTGSIFASDPKFYDKVVNSKIDTTLFKTAEFTALEKIRLAIIFKYYDEIVKGYSISEHIAPLIKRLDKRIEDLDKVITIVSSKSINVNTCNFTIVSFKDVNIHMKKILPLLMCKQLYEEKKSENNKNTYLNIIIDEAHNILSYASERESEIWKDYRLETFEEIIKEGRKFGIFLTIASQRPSDISSTIISQLHNYFLHRLINNKDIEAIEKTISYLDKVSFEYLPILPVGTCILAGILAQVPVIVDISSIDKMYEPDNKTMSLVGNWE
jgi:hypothetical protein